MLGVVPPVLELAKRAEEHVKGMVTPSTLFEEFGFNYIGPIDGHDLDVLVTTLANIRHLRGPQFLHVVTRKGAGYKAAKRMTRYFTTALPSSIQLPALFPKLQANRPIPRSSEIGCAIWRSWINAWSGLRRRCAKARGW